MEPTKKSNNESRRCPRCFDQKHECADCLISPSNDNRECGQTFLAGAPIDNDAPQLRALGGKPPPSPTSDYDDECFGSEVARKLEEVRVENARKMYQNSFGRIEGVDVEPARKDDEGKPRWSLLPWRALAKVVEVLEYGAGKYRAHAWVEVESAEDRYKEALLRHVAAFASGELIDPESGKSHLAHVACNALFLLHFSE